MLGQFSFAHIFQLKLGNDVNKKEVKVKEGGVSSAIWEKHMGRKYNKDVKTILSAHIFQLTLINDVNRR